ncbi:MAG: thioredoxin family protein [Patescibacteria group bacterium]|jgi:small redox-active disulfide protein 2
MNIKVLGSGCPTCKKLYEITKQAVQELGLKTDVEYITDIKKIIELGIMQSPVLVIDGKPIMTGSTSDVDKIKNLISRHGNINQTDSDKKSGCGCGGNC